MIAVSIGMKTREIMIIFQSLFITSELSAIIYYMTKSRFGIFALLGVIRVERLDFTGSNQFGVPPIDSILIFVMFCYFGYFLMQNSNLLKEKSVAIGMSFIILGILPILHYLLTSFLIITGTTRTQLDLTATVIRVISLAVILILLYNIYIIPVDSPITKQNRQYLLNYMIILPLVVIFFVLVDDNAISLLSNVINYAFDVYIAITYIIESIIMIGLFSSIKPVFNEINVGE